MDIFDFLEEMQYELIHGNLTEIERKYYTLCSDKAGKNEAKRIQSVKLEKYRQSIEKGISQSVKLASKSSAKAIYFEYDMDNEWSSNFFICDEYNILNEQDDDWACDWIDEVEGETLEEFADIYSENGFDTTSKALGNTLYLVARTVVTFAHVSQKAQTNIPICIAFHGQDPIMRIKG